MRFIGAGDEIVDGRCDGNRGGFFDEDVLVARDGCHGDFGQRAVERRDDDRVHFRRLDRVMQTGADRAAAGGFDERLGAVEVEVEREVKLPGRAGWPGVCGRSNRSR